MSRLPALAAVVLGVAVLVGPARPADEKVEIIKVPDVPDESGKRPDLAAVAKTIVEKTNEFRKKEGRAAVGTNAKLTDTARYFAEFMAKNDLYGHTADGKDPAQRAKQHKYDYCIVLENIAYAFDSGGFEADALTDKFFTGWRESPPHRKNMLDPDVTETGVAVARSEKTGYYYGVQMFGRPKSAAVVFKVENRAGVVVSYTAGGEAFDLAPRVIRTHTTCRPEELTFTWPDKTTAAVTPAAGNRLVVTRVGGKFAVKKE